MTYLGMELFDAVNALVSEGISVSCLQVRSRKGIFGGVPRVVRIRRSDSHLQAQILFAFFLEQPSLGDRDE